MALEEDNGVPTGVFPVPLQRFPPGPVHLRGPWGLPVPAWACRRVWMAFALTHPDLYLATLLLDFAPVTVSALYLHDRRAGRTWTWTCPVFGLRWGRVAPGPWGERSLVEAPGHRVVFRHEMGRRRHEVSLDLAGTRGRPPLRVEFVMAEDPAIAPPLVVSLPVRAPWYMYTHKAIGPAEGFLRQGDRRWEWVPDRDFAILDEHRAAWPITQRWTWATWAGRLPDGRLLAANLCDNMHYLDPETANENRLWIGGGMTSLGAIRFDHEEWRPLRRWRITESRGRVDLWFEPEGIRRDGFRLGPVHFRYHQVCGRFFGRVRGEDGSEIPVQGLPGACEHGVSGLFREDGRWSS